MSVSVSRLVVGSRPDEFIDPAVPVVSEVEVSPVDDESVACPVSAPVVVDDDGFVVSAEPSVASSSMVALVTWSGAKHAERRRAQGPSVILDMPNSSDSHSLEPGIPPVGGAKDVGCVEVEAVRVDDFSGLCEVCAVCCHPLALAVVAVCCGACFVSNPNTQGDDSADSASSGAGATGGAGTATSTGADAGSGESSTETNVALTSSTSGTGVASVGGSTTTSGVESGDAVTDGEGCGRGSSCLTPGGSGWVGPVVVYDLENGARGPVCPASTDSMNLDLFYGLAADPAECDCSCLSPTGGGCGTTTLEFHGSSDDCSSLQESATVTAGVAGGACLDSFPGLGFWRAAPLDYTGGACEVSATEEVPPPVWAGRTTVCELEPESTSCSGGGGCYASVDPPWRVCLLREGIHECTWQDEYKQRELRWQSVDDNRECSACECGPTQGQCEGDILLYDAEECYSSTPIAIPTDGSCHGIETYLLSAAVPASDVACGGDCQSVVDATCQPAGGAPIGKASPSEAVTLCCM